MCRRPGLFPAPRQGLLGSPPKPLHSALQHPRQTLMRPGCGRRPCLSSTASRSATAFSCRAARAEPHPHRRSCPASGWCSFQRSGQVSAQPPQAPPPRSVRHRSCCPRVAGSAGRPVRTPQRIAPQSRRPARRSRPPLERVSLPRMRLPRAPAIIADRSRQANPRRNPAPAPRPSGSLPGSIRARWLSPRPRRAARLPPCRALSAICAPRAARSPAPCRRSWCGS